MFKSAYNQLHSTENALLKVQNNFTLSLHNCKVTALYLLDLSAGFDTINHTIITVRLSLCYGVSSVAMSWPISIYIGLALFVSIGWCMRQWSYTRCLIITTSVTRRVEFRWVISNYRV